MPSRSVSGHLLNCNLLSKLENGALVIDSDSFDFRPDRGCVDCQEADIWRAVNGTWNTLLEDDREMAAGTVTPSKVVIYFKFDDFKSNEEDLQNVIRSLRKSHKDLYIFVVGPKPEIVEKFRADVKDAVVIIPQAADDRVMQRIASELAYEICLST